MNIVVDGIIYQAQLLGGFSRIFNEILPRMCDMDPSLTITLLTEAGELLQEPPRHARILPRVIPRAERHLRRIPKVGALVRRLWTGSGKGTVWHSTYFTIPEKWNGLVVVTVADMIYERFANWFNKPEDEKLREQKRRCILAADAVICISEATRRDIELFYGLRLPRIEVVPLASSSLFRRKEKSDGRVKPPTAKPFILYVGGRVHYKNFGRLLKAYSVWDDQDKPDLVVVGDRKWSTDEERHLEHMGIANQVHLLTSVDDESLCDLYNQASAFVYPSLYEGFGISLLEAMSCGCPIIASRIPSTMEVAGDCPIYFEAQDIDSMIHALSSALTEGRDSRRSMVGLSHVKKYSWDTTARQTLNIYYELTGPIRSGPYT